MQNTPRNKSSVKKNLQKLHSQKNILKDKYKLNPSQGNLLKIMTTLKHINALEIKFGNASVSTN